MSPDTRDTWGIVLLGLVALSSVVQATLLIAAAVAARRGAERVALLEIELREQLREGLARFQSVAEDVTTVAHQAHRQVERVEHLLDVSTNGARKAVDAAGKALLPPLKLLALYKGVRRGIDIYRARRA
jgi:hypothetical protein